MKDLSWEDIIQTIRIHNSDKRGNMDIFVINVYMPQKNKNFWLKKIEEVIDDINQQYINTNLIITGDFNLDYN